MDGICPWLLMALPQLAPLREAWAVGHMMLSGRIFLSFPGIANLAHDNHPHADGNHNPDYDQYLNEHFLPFFCCSS